MLWKTSGNKNSGTDKHSQKHFLSQLIVYFVLLMSAISQSANAALPSSTQPFSETYWNNNTGGNTVDGFTISESTGALGPFFENSIYFSTAVVKDDPSIEGSYYYELTWTADGVDLYHFDLDGMVIQSLGGYYRLDFSATSGGSPVSQSFTYDGVQDPLTVNLNAAQFNDISAFTLRVTNLSGATSVPNIDLQQLIMTDLYGPNTTPAIGSLNGDSVAWAGVSSTVTMDTGDIAVLSDAELGALNSGAGNWAGASLTVQRAVNTVNADTFGFNLSGALFTVSGSNLQSGGQTFAAFTNTDGVLSVEFTSSITVATTSLVNDVARRITYRSDTPTGDTVIRFNLNDGTASTSADVTVTSDTIFVTDTLDTATIDLSNGVSFSEAVAIAAADVTGSQTLIFSSSFNSTMTLAGDLAINESLTINADAASGLNIFGSAITLGDGTTLNFTNSSGTVTLASALAGSGLLSKAAAGTLVLSNTSNKSGMSGGITVSGGTLSVDSGDQLSSGALTLTGGSTLYVTGTTTIDNGIVLAGNATVKLYNQAATLSGVISGSGNLTTSAGKTKLTLLGSNTFTGTTQVSGGTLIVGHNNALGDTAGSTTVTSGASLALSDGLIVAENITIAGSGVPGTSAFLVSSGAATHTGTITLSSNSNIGVNGESLTLSGVVNNTFTLTKIGTGILNLSGASNFTGETRVNGGSLLIHGSIGNLVVYYGTLAPGNGPGTLTVNGNLTMGSYATLLLDIIGPIAGTQYDQIVVNGAVNVSGATLSGVHPLLYQGGIYTIIDNNAVDAITGNFSGLAQGSFVTFSGIPLAVSYIGGTGNDLTLGLNPPTVTAANISISGATGTGGAYKIGDTVTATWNNTAVGNNNADINGVTVDFSQFGGGAAVVATNSSGTWTATYTIAAGAIDAGNRNISVTATGAGGSTTVADTTNATVDSIAITISSVTVPANNTYGAGENLDFTVNASKAVTVNTGGGTPQLALTIGATTRYASYVSGSGSSAVLFRYTVQTGDNDSDGVAIATSLNANGGTLQDAAGNSLNLTLNAVGSLTSVLVDAVAPNAPSAPDLAAASDTGESFTDNITLVTTPTLTGTAEANSTVILYDTDGTTSLGSAVAAGGSWSIKSSALSDGVHTLTATTTDTAGNRSPASAGLSITIDTTAPAVTGSAPAGAALANAASVTFTVAFNETVYGLAAADFTLTATGTAEGTVASVSAAAASSIDVVVNSISGTGTLRLDSKASGIADLAGNQAPAFVTGSVHTVDRDLPIMNGVAFDQVSVNNLNQTAVSVTLAGAEVGATAQYSISSSNGGAVVTDSLVVAAAGQQVTGINVSGLNDGTLTISLTLTDAAGNSSTPAVTAAINKDGNVPVVNALTIADGRYKVGDSVSFSLTFSEALVLSGANSDYSLAIDIGGVSRQVLLTNNMAGVLTFSYTVQAGENTSDAGIAVASNGLSLLNGATVKDTGNNDATLNFSGVNNSAAQVDTTAPVIARVTDPAQAVFVNAVNYLIKGTHAESGVTINLYTDTGNDGTADGGILLSAVVDADGNWSMIQPLTADSAHNYVVVAEDAAGNTSAAVDVPTITEDSIAPVAPVLTLPAAALAVSTLSHVISGTHPEDSIAVELFADADNDGIADNNTVLASAEVGVVTDGEWSLTAPLTLNAANNFVVMAKDKAANVSAAVDVVTITQDSVAPVVTITALSTADSTPALVGTVDDTSATLSLVVNGQTYTPVNNGNGSWTLADNLIAALGHGVYDVVVSATDAEGNAGTDASVDELTIDLIPPSGYSVVIQQNRIDANNQNALSFVFAGAEVGTTYIYVVSDATTSVTDTGVVTATDQLVSAINVTALAESNLQLSVILTDAAGNNGTAATATVVKLYNATPVISGAAATSVNEDSLYSFTPTATDADTGTVFTFSISNKPGWATFNPATGALTGTPSNDHVGTTTGIVISVSDGALTASLPAFAITVININDAPTISGTPATSVNEDEAYRFVPTASDPDDDTLTFSITNKPTWASFDTATGALTGTPAKEHVGTTTGIVISVSDGEFSASLAAFNLEVIKVNAAPVAVDDNVTQPFSDDHSYLLDVLVNDTDPDDDSLTITAAKTSIGVVSIQGNKLLFTAPDNFGGTATFSYSITDGEFTDKANVTLQIDGSNPAAPVITAPADLIIDATGLFTKVNVGVATAVDVAGNRLAVTLENGLPMFAAGRHELYWRATDAAGVSSTVTQLLQINPLVSLSKAQTVVNNSEVTVEVILNGPAPAYPLEVAYTVSGSANAMSEHDLAADTVLIKSGLRGSIRFNVFADLSTQPETDIVISLDSSLNLGANASTTITVTDANLAPAISLDAQQQGENRLTVGKTAGLVTIAAQVTDPNPGDTVSQQWQADAALTNVSGDATQFAFDPASLDSGVYRIALTATDNAAAPLASTAEIYLLVQDSLPVLDDSDSNNNLIADNVEGLGDGNGNGIADYLDPGFDCNVMPEQLATISQFVAEGEPGICLRKGATAALSNSGGLQLSSADLQWLEPDMQATNIGGTFDFIMRNLPTAAASYFMVLPQRQPVPLNAVYRKFTQAIGWTNFVQNERNQLFSAAGEPGFCPPPGASSWQPGLTAGHWCVQLQIEDGGANDADGLANSTIVDPGGVAVVLNGNQLPVAAADSYSVQWNQNHTLEVLHNDTDPDGDTLGINQVTAAFGSVSISDDGLTLLYTPAQDFVGTDTLSYGISDGNNGSASATVTVVVYYNRPPLVTNVTASTNDKTAVDIDVLAKASDADGDTLTISSASAQTGTVSITPAQTLRYTPKTGFAGTDTISFTVTDNRGGSVSGTVTLSVTAYEVITVVNKSSGGSVGGGSFLLLMLLLVLRRKNALALIVTLAALGSFSAQANWSVDALFGQSTTKQSASDIRGQLPADAELLQYDDSGNSWALGLSYYFSPRLAIQTHYVDLGDASVGMRADTLTPDEFHQAVSDIGPMLAKGVRSGLSYRLWHHADWSAAVQGGVFVWHSETSSTAGDNVIRNKTSATDIYWALVAGYALDQHVTLQAGFSRYHLEGNKADNIMLGVSYSF